MARTSTFLDFTADGSKSGVADHLGGTTNLYDRIQDGSTSTYVENSASADGHLFVLLSDMPADFWKVATGGASNNGLLVELTVQPGGVFTADTLELYVQVFESDETTALTEEQRITRHSDLVAGVWVTKSVNLVSISKPGDEAAWNGARMRLRWDYTLSGAADGLRIRASGQQTTLNYWPDSHNQQHATGVTLTAERLRRLRASRAHSASVTLFAFRRPHTIRLAAKQATITLSGGFGRWLNLRRDRSATLTVAPVYARALTLGRSFASTITLAAARQRRLTAARSHSASVTLSGSMWARIPQSVLARMTGGTTTVVKKILHMFDDDRDIRR